MTTRLLHPAYVAGIIDGEGSVYLRDPRGNPGGAQIPHVSVSNTSFDLISSLHRIGGYAHERNPERGLGNLPAWEWVCSGETAAIVLRACLPFLLVKADKAERALEAWAVPRSTNSAAYRRKARESVSASGWLPLDHPALAS